MEVVTADGELITCSATEHSDLFWAAFGSGPGFFAVVVNFGIRTKPTLDVVYRTVLFFGQKDYDEAFKWTLDIGCVPVLPQHGPVPSD